MGLFAHRVKKVKFINSTFTNLTFNQASSYNFTSFSKSIGSIGLGGTINL